MKITAIGSRRSNMSAGYFGGADDCMRWYSRLRRVGFMVFLVTPLVGWIHPYIMVAGGVTYLGATTIGIIGEILDGCVFRIRKSLRAAREE